ncbi:MAG: hypothetical protein PHE86_03975 [Candidatus Marinimicrobia bacterium]|nr:hypothetical protein [Candidatus Neomarinimicrobiota bacterium]MDD5582536.1 hypothetical protein [Candidatus Neomarinimicrobiota bacterium]
MIKKIFYKEWLKIRWAYLAIAVLFAAVMIYIFASVAHTYKFNLAATYWYNIIFRGISFYSSLRYVPLFSGLLLAAVQFIPEIQKKRIKLTFHLPVNEYNVLLVMAGIGFLSLVVMFGVYCLIFLLLGYAFFPAEIVHSAVLTTFPWYLLGLTAYSLASYIILEPMWKRRIFYILFAVGFGNLFLYGWFYNIYDRVLIGMLIVTILLSISVIYSGHRFKKGVYK